MFLHLSVSHSVHRGGVCLSACWDTHIPWADTHPPPDRHPPCAVHVGIHTPLPSACWDTHPLPSACWDTPPLPSACWDTPPPCPVHAGIGMASAADGTHPTGMHSCFKCLDGLPVSGKLIAFMSDSDTLQTRRDWHLGNYSVYNRVLPCTIVSFRVQS